MKVLQVIDRLEAGGAERVFLDITQLLLDKNIEVDTLTISGKGVLYEKIDKRATHYFLNREKKFSLKKMLECAAICSNYDIVHVHMRHTYTYVKLSQILSGKKYKIIFHDHSSIYKVSFILKFFFKPEFYIGVCINATILAEKYIGIKKDNIFLLRNTIIPIVKKGKEKKNRWLMVSNIRQVKNIEFAIDLATRHNAQLTIFGNFSEVNYKKVINEKNSIHENVEIVENVYDIQSYIDSYTFAIHTSFSETGPLVLLEYLSHGIPFLAYHVGEVANVLGDKLPDFFAKNFNFEEWDQKVCSINKNKYNEDYLNSIFIEYFGPEKYINQCLFIYQKVLSS